VLSASEISQLTQVETAISQKRVVSRALPHTVNTRYISQATYFTQLLGNDFGTNTDDTCIAVACAILLGFCDVYIDDAFVADQYRIRYGTTESFHTLLTGNPYYILATTDLSDARWQINIYLRTQGIERYSVSHNNGSVDTTLSHVANSVQYNRPAIIAMKTTTNPACPMNHAVVAYGYREELVGQEIVSGSYFVHTGWKNDGAHSVYGTSSYSYDWFADSLYLYIDPYAEDEYT
jgi:hypothetical protein